MPSLVAILCDFLNLNVGKLPLEGTLTSSVLKDQTPSRVSQVVAAWIYSRDLLLVEKRI